MASNLVRSMSRLNLFTAKALFTPLRSLATMKSLPINMQLNFNKTPAVVFSSSSNQVVSLDKRFYSSDVNFTADQIEEKVLEILKNFDRVKENPAKPTVN